MEKFQFSSSDSQVIVNAIVEGYREYIEHRQERNREMIISSAFAWTKGNFIESKIAKERDKLNVSYKRAKAGYTWDYLQFVQEDRKKLFLIKNAAYFKEEAFSKAILPSKHTSARRTYLHELSQINSGIFSSKEKPKFITTENQQLTFFIAEDQIKDDLEDLKASYDEFHILTYEIDEAFQISSIIHYLPNPMDNIAYKVEDLSDYISGAELTDEQRDVIAPDREESILDPFAFDIGIQEEDEKKES